MEKEIKEIEIKVSINQDINEANFILAPKSAQNMNEIYAAHLEEKIGNEIKAYKKDVECALDIVRNSEKKIDEFEAIIEESKSQCENAQEKSEAALNMANNCASQDLSNLTETGESKFVNTVGDTMTGDLTIQKANGNVVVSGANGYKSFISNNKDLDYTSIDQINMYGSRVISNDKNGTWFAYNQHGVSSNGNFYNNACVRRSINGTVKQGVLGVTVTKDGYAWAEAPTPNATDNSTKIATTAWVRSTSAGFPDYTKGVSKSNNTQYTADKNGQLIVMLRFASEFQFTYNGTTTSYSPNANGQGWVCIFTYLIKKGAIYKMNTSSGFEKATFYPMS